MLLLKRFKTTRLLSLVKQYMSYPESLLIR
nr:MAG TPA: hypothetical protein [Caudoviricetes sp.]DAN70211.1 MAG TPA: hypothetical protein [Bacteriophage sp.]